MNNIEVPYVSSHDPSLPEHSSGGGSRDLVNCGWFLRDKAFYVVKVYTYSRRGSHGSIINTVVLM